MIAAISGGFDPLHIGHLDLIEAAGKHGAVMVILNTDAWLMSKKGYVFMPYPERRRIMGAIEGVQNVVEANDAPGHVAETLRLYQPDFFVNGGDRTWDNHSDAEHAVCEEFGITEIVGGAKVQSSDKLVKRAMQ